MAKLKLKTYVIGIWGARGGDLVKASSKSEAKKKAEKRHPGRVVSVRLHDSKIPYK